MTKNTSRFESAMSQLDTAFQNAKEDSQKTTRANKTNAALTTASNKTPLSEVDFEQSLQDGIEKLAQRKQKKPSNSLSVPKDNQKEEKTQEVLAPTKELDTAMDKKELDYQTKNLLEHLIQDTINQTVLGILNKNLAKTSKITEQIDFEQTLFVKTDRVKKNQAMLLEKFSQYADIKMNFYVDLGATKIKIKNLFNLKEGDILPTNRSLADFLTFYINKKPIGKGKLTSANSSRGFQICSFYQKL